MQIQILKKNKWILFLMTLMLMASCMATIFGINHNNKNIINLEAKLETVDSLNALETMSVVIVKGQKENVIEQVEVVDPEYNEVIDEFTLSNIKILEVYKNDTKEALTVGNDIKVRENAWMDQNTIYQVAGYQMMENGEEYLLFLGEDEKNGYFYPRGVLFGKISLDETTSLIYEEDSLRQEVGKIHQEALTKYIGSYEKI